MYAILPHCAIYHDTNEWQERWSQPEGMVIKNDKKSQKNDKKLNIKEEYDEQYS